MDSERLMELMQLKMNSHLLEDKQTSDMQQQILDLMQDADGVDSMFEELETCEGGHAIQRAEACSYECATTDEKADRCC
jgi:hypothetical protein